MLNGCRLCKCLKPGDFWVSPLWLAKRVPEWLRYSQSPFNCCRLESEVSVGEGEKERISWTSDRHCGGQRKSELPGASARSSAEPSS